MCWQGLWYNFQQEVKGSCLQWNKYLWAVSHWGYRNWSQVDGEVCLSYCWFEHNISLKLGWTATISWEKHNTELSTVHAHPVPQVSYGMLLLLSLLKYENNANAGIELSALILGGKSETASSLMSASSQDCSCRNQPDEKIKSHKSKGSSSGVSFGLDFLTVACSSLLHATSQ